MPRPSQAVRDKLLARKAQIDARLQDLAAREQKQKRADDTRRKIIAGALVLEHMTIKADFAAEMVALLNRYVTRPQDRALFEFLDDRMPDKSEAENREIEPEAERLHALPVDQQGMRGTA